jgi:acyl-CoA hydrolase
MSPSPPPRPASASRVELAEIVLPGDTNALNTAFGGRVVQWMDLAAAIAARRHTGRLCVTISIDQLTFLAPIRLGSIVTVHAQVNAVFGSSLEVGVDVIVEEPETGERQKCCDAFLTFVALGPDGKPARAPGLVEETAADTVRAREAHARRGHRLATRSPAAGKDRP